MTSAGHVHLPISSHCDVPTASWPSAFGGKLPDETCSPQCGESKDCCCTKLNKSNQSQQNLKKSMCQWKGAEKFQTSTSTRVLTRTCKIPYARVKAQKLVSPVLSALVPRASGYNKTSHFQGSLYRVYASGKLCGP